MRSFNWNSQKLHKIKVEEMSDKFPNLNLTVGMQPGAPALLPQGYPRAHRATHLNALWETKRHRDRPRHPKTSNSSIVMQREEHCVCRIRLGCTAWRSPLLCSDASNEIRSVRSLPYLPLCKQGAGVNTYTWACVPLHRQHVLLLWGR